MNYTNNTNNTNKYVTKASQKSADYTNLAKHFDRDEFLFPFDTVLDQMFASAFPSISKELGVGLFEKQSYPKVDILEYNDKVEIIAEIPGISKENVSVEVKDDVLVISGKKGENQLTSETKSAIVIRKELKHSSFKRSFSLSENIDRDNLKAKFENGMLIITLNKVKPKTPDVKKIKIE